MRRIASARSYSPIRQRYSPGSASVYADVNMIEQVLINLAVNSRDAMPKGGKLIVKTDTVKIDTPDEAAGVKKAGEFVCFSITDSGCGIA